MFQFRFVLLALLIPVAGVSALLAGTSAVHGVVMPPFEAAAGASVAAATGALEALASQSVDAAAAAAGTAEVAAAFQKGPKEALAPTTEIILLKHIALGGVDLAADFGLLIGPDGVVKAVGGNQPTLEPNLAGLPVVAMALTGTARDGVLMVEGAPIHLAASPSYDASGRMLGVVLLGWRHSDKLVEGLSRFVGSPVFIVTGKGVIGALPAGVTAEALAAREPFGSPEGAFGPLPVLVPDVARYLVASLPLRAGENGLSLVTMVDRNAAFVGIADLQGGVLAATLILFFLVMGILASALKAINGPIEIITAHLSHVQQQGVGVGILPEAGLGPMLRLGKQINMLLQALPSSRPGGTAPLFGGASSSQDVPKPSAPLSFGDMSGAPSTPAAPPSFSTSPSPSLGAEASQSNPAAASGALAGLFSDDAPDPLAAFRVPPKSEVAVAPQPQHEPEAPLSDMQPEATVMFQVPEALLAASATVAPPRTTTPPAPPAPPAPAPNVDDNRTLVAQVPHELLAQVSPKNDVDSAEDAHYKEVYEKFVQTRIDCGEDTSDLSYDRFVAKLLKNRQQIIEKHKARSVRFQVYAKDGKAALRALPVRD